MEPSSKVCMSPPARWVIADVGSFGAHSILSYRTRRGPVVTQFARRYTSADRRPSASRSWFPLIVYEPVVPVTWIDVMRALSDRLSTERDVTGPTFWNFAFSFDVRVD